jgi:hypothetical protein
MASSRTVVGTLLRWLALLVATTWVSAATLGLTPPFFRLVGVLHLAVTLGAAYWITTRRPDVGILALWVFALVVSIIVGVGVVGFNLNQPAFRRDAVILLWVVALGVAAVIVFVPDYSSLHAGRGRIQSRVPLRSVAIGFGMLAVGAFLYSLLIARTLLLGVGLALVFGLLALATEVVRTRRR